MVFGGDAELELEMLLIANPFLMLLIFMLSNESRIILQNLVFLRFSY